MAVDYVARGMAMDAAGGTAPVDVYTKAEADALYMRQNSIVKLGSMEDFEVLPEKTADWYFIKEG